MNEGTSALKQEAQLTVLESPKTLYRKLAAVMGEVSRVPKNGWNAHFKYNFATESDIKDVIRPLLAAQNIALIADMVSLSQDGKRTLVEMEFTFACGDTGATISKRFWGEALDNADKGINKAATFAEKYFLINFFMISTGEDPDGDPTDDKPKSNGKQTAAPNTQPAPAKSPETAQDAKSEAFVADDEFFRKVYRMWPLMKQEVATEALDVVKPETAQMAMAAVMAKHYAGRDDMMAQFVADQKANKDWWAETMRLAKEVAPKFINF